MIQDSGFTEDESEDNNPSTASDDKKALYKSICRGVGRQNKTKSFLVGKYFSKTSWVLRRINFCVTSNKVEALWSPRVLSEDLHLKGIVTINWQHVRSISALLNWFDKLFFEHVESPQ